MARVWNKHKQKSTSVKRKVIVGMSGGVDSSVAAALLKKGGFNVTGMYIKCWTVDEPMGMSCTSREDERSARLAADALGIPFYSLNLVEEYRTRVVDYMIDGYKRGVTPNPDVMCNKEIKFGLFFEKAMTLGADLVATGHYARTLKKGERTALLEGADEEKDQSYFLARIRPDRLEKIIFPVGSLKKAQVRELARKFRLPNAERKESQGICFVGNVDVSEFLKMYIPSAKGKIVDMQGNELGEHDGAMFVTIGQRKGIGLSGGPYYVVSKDVAKNIVVVSKDENDFSSSNAVIRDVVWFDPSLQSPLRAEVRVRYRQQATPCVIEKRGEEYDISFDIPQRAIAPGQIAVVYKEKEVLGSGVIC